jgi:hypothetical protein
MLAMAGVHGVVHEDVDPSPGSEDLLDTAHE